MPEGVLIFAEQRDGQLKKTAFEVATVGRNLTRQIGGGLSAVLIGRGAKDNAADLGEYGVTKVYAADDDSPGHYDGGRYATICTDAIRQADPVVVLMPASAMGKDVAPRVAAKLGVGMASECTALTVESGRLIATRPVYAGKAVAKVRLTGDPQLATLRPNVFGVEAVDRMEPDVIEIGAGEPVEPVKETARIEGERPELTEAEIIVSGGRGMGGPEHYILIEELADLLGAAVGASRAAVDAGWRPHSDQVGQTGKTVSPDLYIACGISGAIQHLAGISSSKVIVAVNKDPEAPIFKAATYGIVGDLFEVVPEMVGEIIKIRA